MLAKVGLGGNVGDAETIVRRFSAVWRALAARRGTGRMRGASVYRSAPVGPVVDQPAFLNTVFELELAPVEPEALLGELLALEHTFGRDRRAVAPGGPRTLDLDLLALDALVLASPRLVLPHPRARQRAFVQVPLGELAGREGPRGAGGLALYCPPRWSSRRDA
jgi:2-amino-4-hydroxy-6-hydroxymethyldihydropteridine diphosphokinase